MENKRVLTIQDISCVGQCSLTVALPVLSAMGCECCVLPTAVLSTHTGGFGTPTVVHLDGQLPQMVAHWQRCGIRFDGILVGYLVPTAVLSTHTGGFGTPTVVHLDGQLPQMVAHWQRCGIRFDGILVGYLGSLAAVELTRNGFGTPTVVHLDGQLPQMVAHWQRCGIRFDGILVGYLGSLAAVELTRKAVAELLTPGGVCVVDPVMGDHGRLYSGFDETYVQAMRGLCAEAQILLPNATEAALLTGNPYLPVMGDHGRLYSGFDETYVQAMRGLCAEAQILLPNATEAALLTGNPYLPDVTPEQACDLVSGLHNETVVLTGIGGSPEETGVLLRHQGRFWHHTQERLPGSYQGTGDLFAACFTGALLTGKPLQQAVALAAEFTGRCIRATIASPAHWYQGTGDLFAACFTGALLTGKPLQQAVALAAEFTGRCIRATIASPAHWYGTRFESQLGWLSSRMMQN